MEGSGVDAEASDSVVVQDLGGDGFGAKQDDDGAEGMRAESAPAHADATFGGGECEAGTGAPPPAAEAVLSPAAPPAAAGAVVAAAPLFPLPSTLSPSVPSAAGSAKRLEPLFLSPPPPAATVAGAVELQRPQTAVGARRSLGGAGGGPAAGFPEALEEDEEEAAAGVAPVTDPLIQPAKSVTFGPDSIADVRDPELGDVDADEEESPASNPVQSFFARIFYGQKNKVEPSSSSSFSGARSKKRVLTKSRSRREAEDLAKLSWRRKDDILNRQVTMRAPGPDKMLGLGSTSAGPGRRFVRTCCVFLGIGLYLFLVHLYNSTKFQTMSMLYDPSASLAVNLKGCDVKIVESAGLAPRVRTKMFHFAIIVNLLSVHKGDHMLDSVISGYFPDPEFPGAVEEAPLLPVASSVTAFNTISCEYMLFGRCRDLCEVTIEVPPGLTSLPTISISQDGDDTAGYLNFSATNVALGNLWANGKTLETKLRDVVVSGNLTVRSVQGGIEAIDSDVEGWAMLASSAGNVRWEETRAFNRSIDVRFRQNENKVCLSQAGYGGDVSMSDSLAECPLRQSAEANFTGYWYSRVKSLYDRNNDLKVSALEMQEGLKAMPKCCGNLCPVMSSCPDLVDSMFPVDTTLQTASSFAQALEEANDASLIPGCMRTATVGNASSSAFFRSPMNLTLVSDQGEVTVRTTTESTAGELADYISSSSGLGLDSSLVMLEESESTSGGIARSYGAYEGADVMFRTVEPLDKLSEMRLLQRDYDLLQALSEEYVVNKGSSLQTALFLVLDVEGTRDIPASRWLYVSKSLLYTLNAPIIIGSTAGFLRPTIVQMPVRFTHGACDFAGWTPGTSAKKRLSKMFLLLQEALTPRSGDGHFIGKLGLRRFSGDFDLGVSSDATDVSFSFDGLTGDALVRVLRKDPIPIVCVGLSFAVGSLAGLLLVVFVIERFSGSLRASKRRVLVQSRMKEMNKGVRTDSDVDKSSSGIAKSSEIAGSRSTRSASKLKAFFQDMHTALRPLTKPLLSIEVLAFAPILKHYANSIDMYLEECFDVVFTATEDKAEKVNEKMRLYELNLKLPETLTKDEQEELRKHLRLYPGLKQSSLDILHERLREYREEVAQEESSLSTHLNEAMDSIRLNAQQAVSMTLGANMLFTAANRLPPALIPIFKELGKASVGYPDVKDALDAVVMVVKNAHEQVMALSNFSTRMERINAFNELRYQVAKEERPNIRRSDSANLAGVKIDMEEFIESYNRYCFFNDIRALNRSDIEARLESKHDIKLASYTCERLLGVKWKDSLQNLPFQDVVEDIAEFDSPHRIASRVDGSPAGKGHPSVLRHSISLPEGDVSMLYSFLQEFCDVTGKVSVADGEMNYIDLRPAALTLSAKQGVTKDSGSFRVRFEHYCFEHGVRAPRITDALRSLPAYYAKQHTLDPDGSPARMPGVGIKYQFKPQSSRIIGVAPLILDFRGERRRLSKTMVIKWKNFEWLLIQCFSVFLDATFLMFPITSLVCLSYLVQFVWAFSYSTEPEPFYIMDLFVYSANSNAEFLIYSEIIWYIAVVYIIIALLRMLHHYADYFGCRDSMGLLMRGDSPVLKRMSAALKLSLSYLFAVSLFVVLTMIFAYAFVVMSWFILLAVIDPETFLPYGTAGGALIAAVTNTIDKLRKVAERLERKVNALVEHQLAECLQKAKQLRHMQKAAMNSFDWAQDLTNDIAQGFDGIKSALGDFDGRIKSVVGDGIRSAVKGGGGGGGGAEDIKLSGDGAGEEGAAVAEKNFRTSSDLLATQVGVAAMTVMASDDTLGPVVQEAAAAAAAAAVAADSMKKGVPVEAPSVRMSGESIGLRQRRGVHFPGANNASFTADHASFAFSRPQSMAYNHGSFAFSRPQSTAQRPTTAMDAHSEAAYAPALLSSSSSSVDKLRKVGPREVFVMLNGTSADRDNALSLEEFNVLFNEFGFKLPEHLRDQLFAHADLNCSGDISEEEFISAWDYILSQISRAASAECGVSDARIVLAASFITVILSGLFAFVLIGASALSSAGSFAAIAQSSLMSGGALFSQATREKSVAESEDDEALDTHLLQIIRGEEDDDEEELDDF